MVKHSVFIGLLFAFGIPRALFSQWSAEFGVTYNSQSGSFQAPCLCTFSNGDGVGYHAALTYDVISFWGLSLGLKPGVEVQNFTSTSNWKNEQAQQKVSLDYFSIGPYLRYTVPALSIFVEAEPEAQYVIGSSYQRIPQYDGESPDTSLDARSQRYAAAFSVGYRFHFLLLDVSPMLTADIPLNELRSEVWGQEHASDWKVSMYTASLVIFF